MSAPEQSASHTAWIAIGGNQGDPLSTFAEALRRLPIAGRLDVVQHSSWQATSPIGSQSSSAYLNGAIELRTCLNPLALLDHLQRIERELGRVRSIRWGPRTLDLDLLLFDDEIIDTDRLQVPHPACWYRRFVLDPLAEIAPQVRHPMWGLTITELRSRLLVRPLTVRLADAPPELEQQIRCSLAAAFSRQEVQTVNGDKLSVTLPIRLQVTPGRPLTFRSRKPMELCVSGPREELAQAVCDVLTAALGPPVANLHDRYRPADLP